MPNNPPCLGRGLDQRLIDVTAIVLCTVIQVLVRVSALGDDGKS